MSWTRVAGNELVSRSYERHLYGAPSRAPYAGGGTRARTIGCDHENAYLSAATTTFRAARRSRTAAWRWLRSDGTGHCFGQSGLLGCCSWAGSRTSAAWAACASRLSRSWVRTVVHNDVSR